MPTLSRSIASAAVLACAVGGLVVAAASPAAAVTDSVPAVVAAYTDAAMPTTATAAPDANGILTIQYTPTTPGAHSLVIGFGLLADGTSTDGTSYSFIAG